MASLLVTGGAGFIGSHLTRRLLAEGHRVVVVDDLSTGCAENVPAEADFESLDVAEPGFTRRLPKGIEAVLHLAAQSSGDVSQDDPERDLRTNALSTLELTRWCSEQGVPRMIYASSMAAYGAAEGAVDEAAPCAPLSYYGVSKLASEHFLRLATLRGLSCTAFRIFSCYGPGQNLANLRQGMVSIYLSYLVRGEAVPVTGSLERSRDFVYVDDVVDAWVRALALPRTPSLVYNLSGGTSCSVRELLALLVELAGLPADHPIEEQPGSPHDQLRMRADLRRAREELGWSPRVSLRTGLEAMVEWARKIG